LPARAAGRLAVLVGSCALAWPGLAAGAPVADPSPYPPGEGADDGVYPAKPRASKRKKAAVAPPGVAPARRARPRARRGEEVRPVEDDARALTISTVRVVGREQVAERQIARILDREGLVAGAEILWPSDPRIERARDRLRATGYFKSVTLRVETLAGSTTDVALVVDLQERSSASLQALYLGSSRMTPFHGGLSVVERNFLGRGVHIGGALVWGTLPQIAKSRRQQAYTLFAEAPRLGNAPLGLRGSAYVVSAAEPYRVAGDEDDPDPSLFKGVDVGRIGGSLGITFPVLPSLTIGVDYRFERVDAVVPSSLTWVQSDGSQLPVSVDLKNGAHRLTSAHFGLLWDGREEVFLAGKGGRVALDLQLSSPAIGSSYEYIKLVVGGAYSFRLPWRHWITPSITGGQIAGTAPVYEQFYSGDLSAWTPGRELGIRYSTRNPIDVFGTGVSSRTFGVLFGRFDLEYAIPLFRRTRTRVVYGGDLVIATGIFTLVGNKEERERRRAADESVAPIGFNADLGLRLDTAAGTFRVTIGNLLRRTPL
jgi:outer membrane protein insertion porin family